SSGKVNNSVKPILADAIDLSVVFMFGVVVLVRLLSVQIAIEGADSSLRRTDSSRQARRRTFALARPCESAHQPSARTKSSDTSAAGKSLTSLKLSKASIGSRSFI